MSLLLRGVAALGALTAVVLLVLMIISISGGFHHTLSNPPT
ncbi:MAG TPA: hypothetical protein PK691_00810 [Thermomicrobiales bacterium]|nr:hypothetical protein [Thermomicrobiales bacterium]HRA48199.1 hypothetical protein [Thermomicrobiales bacterium]